jgi:hypothetical protein
MVVRLLALLTVCTLLPKKIICLLLAKGLDKLKKSFTSSGLEPATFQLVVYCFNHYATACPIALIYPLIFIV